MAFLKHLTAPMWHAKFILTAAIFSPIPTTGCPELKRGFREGVNQADYTEPMKTRFLSSCVDAAVNHVTTEAAQKHCDCTFDRVSSTAPVKDFVKPDNGEPISNSSRMALRVAIAQCGGDAKQL